jgi:hypothetical protein
MEHPLISKNYQNLIYGQIEGIIRKTAKSKYVFTQKMNK